MTVSTEVNQAAYTGNGVTTIFPYTFRILNSSNLTVTRINLLEVENVLTLGTDYTVSGAGTYNGGAVTLPQPLPSGYSLVIERDLAAVQETDLRNQGTFYAEVHEDVFDYLTMLIQQVTSWLGLALRRPTVKSKFYDAKQYRIANLADPANQQDAVNNRTMQSYVDKMIAGIVGGYGWFIQAGAGAIYRTFQSKMRDVVSVTDFSGCDPTGVSDSTIAFLSAGAGAYVPKGNYFVNTLQLDIHQYWGEGIIRTTGGQLIDLGADFIKGDLVQKKMMEPFFGFNNGIIDTQIYDQAQYAPQGMAYYRDPVTGVEKVFINQSVAGTSWGPDDTVRITEFLLKEDGSVVNPTLFTNPLLVTHSHLSAINEGGQLYLYSSSKTNDATNLTNSTGKGWSKIAYKGNSTANTDIQNFYVFGNPGSGHRYEQYGKGCVQVSSCGKYVIIMAYGYSGGGGRFLFVYDRKTVESMSNPLDAEPVFKPVAMKELLTSGNTAMQGEACDGKYIYTLWGAGNPFGRRGINVHTLNGDFVRTIYLDGPASQYTNSELMNGNTFGLPRSFEPEGITIRGNEILVNFVDYFGTATDVVTYQGKNYANTQLNNTGNQPNIDQLHWVETSVAANKGTWNPVTVYGYGPANRRSKTIYAIRNPLGTPDEIPLARVRSYAPSAATFAAGYGNLVYATVPFGKAFDFSLHDEIPNLYRNAFKYHLGYTLSVYDSRDGSDNTKRLAMRMASTPAAYSGQLIAGNGTATGGASVTLFTSDSPSSAGEARLASAGGALVRLQIDGDTMFAASTTYVSAYQNLRFIADATFNFGSAAFRANNIYLVNNPIVTSDERLKSLRDGGIDDKAISAWDRVSFEQYALIDEIYIKGTDAKWNFGVLAQQIISCFAKEGLDALEYNLVSYEKWDDEYDENGDLVKSAGDIYLVRYDQCNILEAISNRRARNKLDERIKALESK